MNFHWQIKPELTERHPKMEFEHTSQSKNSFFNKNVQRENTIKMEAKKTETEATSFQFSAAYRLQSTA